MSGMATLKAIITPELVELVVVLINVLLTALITQAIVWLRGHTKVAQNAAVGQLLTRVERVVLACVQEAEQTTVKTLKASAADGKLTTADMVLIKRQVVERVKVVGGQHLLNEVRGALKLAPTELEALVESAVEQAVNNTR
jgi:hypothetical protein